MLEGEARARGHRDGREALRHALRALEIAAPDDIARLDDEPGGDVPGVRRDVAERLQHPGPVADDRADPRDLMARLDGLGIDRVHLAEERKGVVDPSDLRHDAGEPVQRVDRVRRDRERCPEVTDGGVDLLVLEVDDRERDLRLRLHRVELGRSRGERARAIGGLVSEGLGAVDARQRQRVGAHDPRVVRCALVGATEQLHGLAHDLEPSAPHEEATA